MVFVSCQFYLALFTVNSGSLSIVRSTCLFLNFSENLGIFRVALLFICQGAVLLIGSISRRTFVPVVQTAYWVYHKQFCLSRTFFILFSSFFRNPVAYHSQQQFSSLSELPVHVKQFFIFLNFFSEIRVAFDCRNSHKFYQDYSSMSSTFSSFLKKKFHRISCGGTSV